MTVILIAMRYIDIYWLVGPAHHGINFYFSWMSVAALVGIGAVEPVGDDGGVPQGLHRDEALPGGLGVLGGAEGERMLRAYSAVRGDLAAAV